MTNGSGEVIDTGGGGYGLNWGQLIMRQVDRIMRIASENLTDHVCEEKFRNAVRAYETLFAAYIDEEYEGEKEAIKHMDEPYNAISTVDEYWCWLNALNKLAGRCGLMPFEEGAVYDEGNYNAPTK